MLQRDEQHARRPVRLPVLSEALLRAAASTAGAAATATAAAESPGRASGEMTFVIHDGILHIRMLLVVLWQQDGRAEVDRDVPTIW